MKMSRLVSALFGALALSLPAEDVPFKQLMSEPLGKSVKLGNFELDAPGDTQKFDLPDFSPRNGKIPVLRFRMVSYMPKSNGCNYSAVISVNGTDLGPTTAAQTNRMIGKAPVFEMKSIYKGRSFAYWGRKNADICVPYGPDWETVDIDSVDGAATAFILDLSDVISSGNGNVLTFRNIRNHIDGIPLKVMIRDCEVGYLSKSKMMKSSGSQRPVKSKKTAPGDRDSAEKSAFKTLMSEPLGESVELGNFELDAPGDTQKFDLPDFSPRNGKIPVLRFRMVSYMPKSNGCNYSAVISVNGTDLGPTTAAQTNRMIGKAPVFEMKSIYKGRSFAYWGRKNADICVPYGPDWETVDIDSVDGAATAFILDLSDVISSGNGNVLTFRNIRNHIDGVTLKVMVRDCEVGYLDQSRLQEVLDCQERN